MRCGSSTTDSWEDDVARKRRKTDGGTKSHPERKRVSLKDAELLKDRLAQEGFKVTIRHDGSTVYAWNTDDDFACAFYWVKGIGWRFDVAQPYIFTHADVDFAVDELHRSQTASKKVREMWEKYRTRRTERAWENYQGTLAAHNFRQLGGSGK
jgi:hypothetical protein